ncbi:MAG: tetratricopeptide repeat protein [Planctomycetes bacterium]|nr:tetratricopeptide repeat protein [Planctomycetota bacterium]MBT4028679.1 tetratricopeptide repeat protein [Planctomycetota bacterium]MBT4560107.1 tetratricopeptide repeat protein [Planctomycetota bacterium]MBT5102245.1 tetratricopeptide repeat protein [Planctomycetota bacterium]MBT5120501.1 tetratricopeptide repeat protein [Planctomycetota bacterium]
MKASRSRLLHSRPTWGLAALALVSFFAPACQTMSHAFGERGDFISAQELAQTQGPEMSFLPAPLRPTLRDFARMPALSNVVGLIRAADWSSAAMRLTAEKTTYRTSSHVEALHAWVLLQINERETALKMATFVVDYHEPKSPAAYVLAVDSRERGDFAAALPLYQIALKSHPRDSGLLREMAHCAFSSGQEAESIVLLDRLMVVDPLSSEDLTLRARALVTLRRYEAALLIYGRLQKDSPGDVALLLEAGQCAFAGNQYDKAISLCNEVTQLDPQNAEAHFVLGMASASFLDPAGAEAAFSRALELKPDYLKAGHALAVLLSNQGMIDEAYAALNQLSRQPLSSVDLEKVQGWLNELED